MTSVGSVQQAVPTRILAHALQPTGPSGDRTTAAPLRGRGRRRETRGGLASAAGARAAGTRVLAAGAGVVALVVAALVLALIVVVLALVFAALVLALIVVVDVALVVVFSLSP